MSMGRLAIRTQVRQAALDHVIDSARIGGATGSRNIAIWSAGGSNVPGAQNLRNRRQWFVDALGGLHVIGAWRLMARAAAPRARMRTRHRYHSQKSNRLPPAHWARNAGRVTPQFRIHGFRDGGGPGVLLGSPRHRCKAADSRMAPGSRAAGGSASDARRVSQRAAASEGCASTVVSRRLEAAH